MAVMGRRAYQILSRKSWTGKVGLGVVLAAAFIAAPASARHKFMECAAVSNAQILASDGTFLGALTEASRADSVLNKSGRYGSKLASNGLWNPNSAYGSISSDKSPMNGQSGRPATVLKDGKEVGKLMRGSLRPWIEDPTKLVQRCYGFQP